MSNVRYASEETNVDNRAVPGSIWENEDGFFVLTENNDEEYFMTSLEYGYMYDNPNSDIAYVIDGFDYVEGIIEHSNKIFEDFDEDEDEIDFNNGNDYSDDEEDEDQEQTKSKTRGRFSPR